MTASDDWIPIDPENRPEGLVQLWRPTKAEGLYDIGGWVRDTCNEKPQPYWGSKLFRFLGINWMRDYPPSHYMPLPKGPNGEEP